MTVVWVAAIAALAAGAGFAVAWVVASRLVIRLQLAPVAIENVELPVDATVVLNGALEVDVQVPVEAALTAGELGIDRLTVPIDITVPIEEDIAIDTVLAIDTTVTSVLGITVPIKASIPVKTTVPIRQRVRVKENVEIRIGDLRIPLRAVVPVRARVPIVEPLRVSGTVKLAEALPVQLGTVRIKASDVKVGLS